MAPLFRDRFRERRRTLREGRLAILRRRSITDLFTQTIATVAIFGAFAFICRQTIPGLITLGALVMYFQGFQMGLGFLQAILRGLAGLYEDNLFLTEQEPAHPKPLPVPVREGIAFEGVHFTYPGSDREAVAAVDLSLALGEVIALVGENGSVEDRILFIRGHRVMLDADLAELYGVQTKALNQAIKRNAERFPEDFAFRLTTEEKKEPVINCDRFDQLKHSTVFPLAFAEHVAIMAASVLNSPRAIEVSDYVVRAFVKNSYGGWRRWKGNMTGNSRWYSTPSVP